MFMVWYDIKDNKQINEIGIFNLYKNVKKKIGKITTYLQTAVPA